MGDYIIADNASGRAIRLVVEPHGAAWRAAILLPLRFPDEDHGEECEIGHADGDYHDVSRRGWGVAQSLLDRADLWERFQ